MMYFEFTASYFGGSCFKIRRTNSTNDVVPIRNKGKISQPSFDLKINLKSWGRVEMEFTKEDLHEPETVSLEYLYYTPHSFPVIDKKNEGAYVFRPIYPSFGASSYDSFSSYDFYDGRVVQMFVLYGKHMKTLITANSLSSFIEIETQHKGIRWDVFGADVIIRLTNKNIKNQKTFYTDSMGLELQKRILDYRPTWSLKVTEPIAGNYYPVGHGIYIKDEDRTLELLNDRSQGGTSLNEGQVELMIHRRSYYDDHKGLHEALDERQTNSLFSIGVPATTKHWFRFYNNSMSYNIRNSSRWMQRQIDNPLVYVFGDLPQHQAAQCSNPGLYGQQSLLELPDQVKLVLLPDKDYSIFLRFENTADLLSSDLSVNINMEEIAKSVAESIGLKVKSINEVSNTGLYSMEEMKNIKMRWKAIDFQTPDPDYSSNVTNVELSSQRIRSFVIEFRKKSDLKEHLMSV